MEKVAKKTVLFLCTGNSCRSQIAEGFARQMGAGVIEAYSAGIRPVRINPRAIQVMSEIGIDLSTHSSKSVEAIDQDRIDIVVTLCGDAAENCPTFPRPIRRIHWPLADPAKARGSEEEAMAVFRATREAIRIHVAQLIDELSETY